MAVDLTPDYRQLIQSALSQVGMDAGVSSRVPLDALWSLYEDKGRLSPRLQLLYTKRDAIDFLRTATAGMTDFGEAGVTQSDSQIFKALGELRADVQSDITALEGQIRGGGQMAIGVITRTEGGTPNPLCPDPADTRYIGDALKRPLGPRY